MFDCQNFSDIKKVRLAAAEFTGYAINWYDRVVTSRRRAGEAPVDTWDELSMLMRRRFVLDHYHRDLHHKLKRLLQGSNSVEDYHQEMETLMIKAAVEEPLDATMARFFTGLNRDIQDRMELEDYDSMEQMLHKAVLIEQQVKRKGLTKPTFALNRPLLPSQTIKTRVSLLPQQIQLLRLISLLVLIENRKKMLPNEPETSNALGVMALATMPTDVQTKR